MTASRRPPIDKQCTFQPEKVSACADTSQPNDFLALAGLMLTFCAQACRLVLESDALATSMKSVSLLSAALALTGCLPCLAQGYSYNYGDARVVDQRRSGLLSPSATYIGPGTSSQSGRGLPAGAPGSTANPLLPRVNMGANVRTPGDNLYQQGAVQYQQRQNAALPAARMGASVGTPGDGMRSDLRPYPQGQKQKPYYRRQPGPPQPGILYQHSGGVASYGEQTIKQSAAVGARRF